MKKNKLFVNDKLEMIDFTMWRIEARMEEINKQWEDGHNWGGYWSGKPKPVHV